VVAAALMSIVSIINLFINSSDEGFVIATWLVRLAEIWKLLFDTSLNKVVGLVVVFLQIFISEGCYGFVNQLLSYIFSTLGDFLVCNIQQPLLKILFLLIFILDHFSRDVLKGTLATIMTLILLHLFEEVIKVLIDPLLRLHHSF
jgi:hypothetical protein